MTAKSVHMDSRASDYLQEELRHTNHLGRLVLASVDVTRGSMRAILPSPYTGEPYAFKNQIFPAEGLPKARIPGGYVIKIPSTEGAVSAWVHRVLTIHPRSVLVSELLLLYAEDLGRVAYAPPRTAAIGKFLYFWAASGDAATEVADVVRETYRVPMGYGVISVLPDGVALDVQDLNVVARNTQCILLGVYDGESVLIWLRDGTSFQLPGLLSE